MIVSPNLSMARSAKQGQGGEGGGSNPDPPPTMVVRDTNWSQVDLTWEYRGNSWSDPCVLQRIGTGDSWPEPDFDSPQDVETNFIFIGIREANRYIDNGLEPGTTYRYRVAYVTNWEDVVRTGATPVYSNREYGLATTESASFTEYDVVEDFGADPTGTSNSWTNFQSAFAAMRANGNPTKLYCPAGTYLCYPVSANVQWDGQYLSVVRGQSFEGSFIGGDMSDCVIYGDTDGNGDPTTFFNMRLWHNRPGTEWLTVLASPGGDPGNDNDIFWNGNVQDSIRRCPFWVVGSSGFDIKNIQLRDVDIDMTAPPVSTGIRFELFDDARFRWDQTHYVMKGFWNSSNWYMENVRARNCRGEIFYTGGFGHEKIKMVDCRLSVSNSSITSFSANTEYENCVFTDFANAAIESAAHSRDGDDTDPYLESAYTGLQFWQDTIARGCVFNCLDQSANGKFKNLGDLGSVQSSFSGIHIFNQKETFCTITDCTVQNFRNVGYGPWYESFNVFINNLTIESPRYTNSAFLYMNPRSFPSYLLSGGQDWCYWGNVTLDFNGLPIGQGGTIWTNYTGMDTQDNFTIDKLHIEGNGSTFKTLWQDQYGNAGRDDFQLRDWTSASVSMDASGSNLWVNLSGSNMKYPRIVNFGMNLAHQRVISSGGVLEPRWGLSTVLKNSAGTSYNVDDINNLGQHRTGCEFKFTPFDSGHTITFPQDSAWNTFSQNYAITGSQVLTCKVVDQGTKKLQFVSLS